MILKRNGKLLSDTTNIDNFNTHGNKNWYSILSAKFRSKVKRHRQDKQDSASSSSSMTQSSISRMEKTLRRNINWVSTSPIRENIFCFQSQKVIKRHLLLCQSWQKAFPRIEIDFGRKMFTTFHFNHVLGPRDRGSFYPSVYILYIISNKPFPEMAKVAIMNTPTP